MPQLGQDEGDEYDTAEHESGNDMMRMSEKSPGQHHEYDCGAPQPDLDGERAFHPQRPLKCLSRTLVAAPLRRVRGQRHLGAVLGSLRG
jgi:hypothetical protein